MNWTKKGEGEICSEALTKLIPEDHKTYEYLVKSHPDGSGLSQEKDGRKISGRLSMSQR